MATDVATLQALIHGRWNAADAGGFAALFTDDGIVVGFDGSVVRGRAAIDAHLRSIFADHQTARYVGVVRAVQSIATDVAQVLAVAGMVPPGRTELEPKLNAVQTIIAVRMRGDWRIAQLQNTPASLDMDPDGRLRLTEELRALVLGNT